MMDSVASHKYLKIQEWAKEDRPREKLVTQGAALLSNAELLAILLGSGVQNMTSIDLAKYVLKGQDESLHSLGRLSIQELIRYRGIGYAKATIIASAMELSRRIGEQDISEKPTIKDSKTAYKLIRYHFANKTTEECWVMLMNHHHKLIRNYHVSKGGLARTTIDPKVVFKAAIDFQASSIILTHNHPSGNLNPSKSDIEMTETILKGARYLGIKVLDHLIITANSYFSFKDHGMV